MKPFQTNFYSDCQDDLERFCRRAGLPADVPYADLPEEAQRLVWEGEPGGRQDWQKKWYGDRRASSSGSSRARTGCTCASSSPATAATAPAPTAAARGSRPRRGSSGSPGARSPRSRPCRWPRRSARFREWTRPRQGSRLRAAPPRGPRPAALPRGRGPRLPDPRPAVADPLGRRGAARDPRHRPRRLAHQHALRARRAVGGPAPARRGSPLRASCAGWRTPATPWSWSSTTRRSSPPPTTSSTSARGPAARAARSSTRARSRASSRSPARRPGRTSRAALAMPAPRDGVGGPTPRGASSSAARARTTSRTSRSRSRSACSCA